MSGRKGILALVLAVMAMLLWPQSADAGAWYNNLWTYRKPITIQSGQVPSTQSSFPVLINLASDSGLTAHARSDGFDILFTSGDGVTKIPYEREKYTSGTGALVAWVQVPTVSTGTVLYMYYGNAGATDQQNPTGVWDANYQGVWHLNETGAGTAGEYKDATSTPITGTLTGTSVLKAAYNMTASGNSYVYENLTSVTAYSPIASGDTVEYDVYWTSATDLIAFDFTTNLATLRDSGATDQNSVPAHPSADLSARALNKWYHRKIPIPAGLVGQTISHYDIACESDATSTKTAYIANVKITNGTGIKKLIYSSGDAFTHANDFPPSNGAINSFANATDPASTTATGQVATALNSDGARYVSMASSPSSAVSNWTLEAWINPAILSQHGYVVYNGNDAGGYGFGMGDPGGTAGLGSKLIGLYGSVTWIDSGYTFASASSWYHVVMVRSATTTSFYVNGVQTPNTSVLTPLAVTSHFTIGNELDASNRPYRYFNGLVDDVRISNAARLADWIRTEYNNQSAPSTFYSVGGEQPRPRAQVL